MRGEGRGMAHCNSSHSRGVSKDRIKTCRRDKCSERHTQRETEREMSAAKNAAVRRFGGLDV